MELRSKAGSGAPGRRQPTPLSTDQWRPPSVVRNSLPLLSPAACTSAHPSASLVKSNAATIAPFGGGQRSLGSACHDLPPSAVAKRVALPPGTDDGAHSRHVHRPGTSRPPGGPRHAGSRPEPRRSTTNPTPLGSCPARHRTSPGPCRPRHPSSGPRCRRVVPLAAADGGAPPSSALSGDRCIMRQTKSYTRGAGCGAQRSSGSCGTMRMTRRATLRTSRGTALPHGRCDRLCGGPGYSSRSKSQRARILSTWRSAQP